MHTFYFNKLSGKKYWLNGGVTPDASDTNLNSLATGITHKLGYSYNGYIFEIICYNRAINEKERVDIEKYLSNSENKSSKNNTKIDINFIENQIALRQKYKSEKNFAKADEIRLKLSELGVMIEDKPNSITTFTIK
jgi:cysteinyl-tRNA synthetase